MTELVLARIKTLLKAKGMTYAGLAEQLAVSEVTVKRMLNQDDISLQRLAQVAKVLGISLFEELAELEKAPVKAHTFSVKQDEYFAKYPHLAAYFQQLSLMGKTPEQIAKDHQLSGACNHQYLTQLENLELIRRSASGSVSLLVEPPMGFGTNSQVVKQQIAQSLAYTYDQLFDQTVADPNCCLLVKPLKLNKALRRSFAKEYMDLLQSYAKISERNYDSDDPLFLANFALHSAAEKGQPEVIALKPCAFV